MSTLAEMLEWAVSPAVTGMLQWIGTAIAVIGLPLTYFKAKKAAAEATLAAQAVTKFNPPDRRAMGCRRPESWARD